MENKLLLNNATLAGLRRLREALRKKVGDNVAIKIEFVTWHYDFGRIVENIGVYFSGTGGGTREFNSLKEAHTYVRSIERKEETNATTN